MDAFLAEWPEDRAYATVPNDDLRAVVAALHTAEEECQWLCKNLHRITMYVDGNCEIERREYDNLDALVTAELSRTKETAS